MLRPLNAGDTFFTPAGRIHAIGAGIVLAEIQQTSDITYRIYDWGRTDKKGAKRELHTDLALDAIDFSAYGKSKIRKDPRDNKPENLVNCEFFNTNIIHLDDLFERTITLLILLLCTFALKEAFQSAGKTSRKRFQKEKQYFCLP